MSKLVAISIFMLADVATSQFMGYPYDYSSMFSGYTGYNPMMGMNSLGSTGFGAFGTGMESLYGQQTAFNAYNPYGNGMFNFGNNGLFGQNAFGNGFNSNLFGAGLTNGLNVQQQPQQQPQQQTFQNSMLQNTQMSTLNNGNTMRAYGRRTQNFNNNNNNNYAPTRVGQTGCNGFGCQQGWQAKSKA